MSQETVVAPVQLLVDVATGVGVLTERVEALGKTVSKFGDTLVRVEASCEMQRVDAREHSTAIGHLQQDMGTVKRKVSDLYHRVDATEHTGEHLIEKARTTWTTLRYMGIILLGIISLVGVTVTVIKLL